MGFAGALHPLLTLDELDKELCWTTRNPWSTGVMDLFDAKPSALAPRLSDLERPAALELYRSSGFGRLCVELERAARPRSLDGLTLVPVIRLAPRAGPATETSRRIRRAAGQDALLMIELSAFPSEQAFQSFFDELLKAVSSSGIVLSTIEDVDGRAGTLTPTSAPGAPWDELPASLLRHRLSLASAYQRKKKKKNEDYRKILNLLAFPPGFAESPMEGNAVAPSARKDNGKTLVAHMQGDVALAGRDFDVRLSGGRFSGIVYRGRYLLPNIPASSFMTICGKTFHFKTRSSISFEGDDGTGLRDELSLETGNGRRHREAVDASRCNLAIEYEFRGDAPELFIGAVLSYPLFTAGQIVEALAPLAIPLTELRGHGPARVEAICPDGSRAVHVITERDGWKPVSAMTWLVEAQGARILLHTAPPAEKRWGLGFFRITRSRRRRLLEANPFGSAIPTPGPLISGKTEAFTLFIGIEEDRKGAG